MDRLTCCKNTAVSIKEKVQGYQKKKPVSKKEKICLIYSATKRKVKKIENIDFLYFCNRASFMRNPVHLARTIGRPVHTFHAAAVVYALIS